MPKTEESYLRSLTYLRGFADGAGLKQTQLALMHFVSLHGDQKRNDGMPFASHPLYVCGHAISLGIRHDAFLASLLLHDVLEDTNTSPHDLYELGFDSDTVYIVTLLTKQEDQTVEEYFKAMRSSRWAMLGKVFDRIHNISTMAGVFSTNRARKFIDETIDFVYPLIEELKGYPGVVERQTLYSLKYSLEALVDSIDKMYRGTEE